MPRRGLRGGHFQTLASFFLPRRIAPFTAEKRLIEVEPGVRVLCHCHWQADRENALTVIIVHGLEGSSESQYMLGIAAKGTAVGMNVVRMNQRNCGGTDALSPTLYHSGRSQDVAANRWWAHVQFLASDALEGRETTRTARSDQGADILASTVEHAIEPLEPFNP